MSLSTRRAGWHLAGVAALAAAVLVVTPVAGITYGVIDTTHTNVGAILVFSLRFQEWFEFCSGTLVSERVFLTAGHCTDALERNGVALWRLRVSFSLNLWTKDAKWLDVAAYESHPDYNWGPTSDPHDLGVIVLEKPVRSLAPATLAPVGYLDRLEASGALPDATFINVGYGIDEAFESDGYRKISFSTFLSLHDAWLYMSQNIHAGSAGTCSGDSGGPTFHDGPLGEVIVSVTSWGDAQCVATNINYRVDTESGRGFVDASIATYG
ncbi:MAG: S1 family peptidase [Methanobacteriota archaeon]